MRRAPYTIRHQKRGNTIQYIISKRGIRSRCWITIYEDIDYRNLCVRGYGVFWSSIGTTNPELTDVFGRALQQAAAHADRLTKARKGKLGRL